MTDDESITTPARPGSVDRRTAIVSLATVLGVAGCSSEVTPRASRTSTDRKTTGGPTPVETSAPTSVGAQGTTTQAPARSAEPAIARIAGQDIVHGPRTRSEVALTFHGPVDTSLAEQILRDCADPRARITVSAAGK